MYQHMPKKEEDPTFMAEGSGDSVSVGLGRPSSRFLPWKWRLPLGRKKTDPSRPTTPATKRWVRIPCEEVILHSSTAVILGIAAETWQSVDGATEEAWSQQSRQDKSSNSG